MRSPFAHLVSLWHKEALALSRDRFGLATLFVMPSLFILIMSLALRDTMKPGGAGPHWRYAWVDLDQSKASRELASELATSGFTRDAAATSESESAKAIREGRLPFAVIVPQGFEQHLQENLGAEAQVILQVDPTVAVMARSAFRQHLLGAVGTLKARAFLRTLDPMFGGAAAASLTPDQMQEAVKEQCLGRLETPPTAVQQNVPAWMIFGMFFVAMPLATIFITERRQGTLQRQRAMGLGHGLLLAGKLVPFMGVNLLQALLMVAVGLWGVPLLGGEALRLPVATWLPLLGVVLCVSFAAVSWALLVATLVRTQEQATILGGVGNILMAALGGIMVPRFVMPSKMQALTQVSPMAWGLDAFHAVLLRSAELSRIAPELTRLLLFGTVALTLAAWIAHRSRS